MSLIGFDMTLMGCHMILNVGIEMTLNVRIYMTRNVGINMIGNVRINMTTNVRPGLPMCFRILPMFIFFQVSCFFSGT